MKPTKMADPHSRLVNEILAVFGLDNIPVTGFTLNIEPNHLISVAAEAYVEEEEPPHAEY